MKITQEFVDAVNSKDITLVRIMLKDSLVVDPTFREFNEMIKIVEGEITEFYDEHDGEVLKYEADKWSKDYMDEQMVQVVYNFSKDRVELLKSVCRHIYKERIDKIESANLKPKVVSTQKKAGAGLAIVGGGVATIGLVIKAPILAGLGAIAGITGAVIIIKDK